MMVFLLDTKLGHLLLGLVCVALAGAGMYWFQSTPAPIGAGDSTKPKREQTRSFSPVCANLVRRTHSAGERAVVASETGLCTGLWPLRERVWVFEITRGSRTIKSPRARRNPRP